VIIVVNNIKPLKAEKEVKKWRRGKKKYGKCK
jgi:hypothetical protein